MNRPLLSATVTLTFALSLAGCGSVTGIDDLFSSGAGGTAATTGQGGAPGVTTGVTSGGMGGQATTVTSGPTTTGDTTSSASGPPMTTGSTATSTSGATSSASGPGSSSVSASASSSSGGLMNTVFCNNAECAVGQICCFNLSQQTDHCGQAGSCGDGFIDLSCNGPEDCPGGICCGDVDFQNNPPYKGIACKQSCNNPQNTIVICSDADPTCPAGKQCKQSMFLGAGYKVCN